MNEVATFTTSAIVYTALLTAMHAYQPLRGIIAPAHASEIGPAHRAPPATSDAVTVYSGGMVENYTGTLDNASTSAQRVEMHADDYSGGKAAPPAGDLGDGYEVTIYAADGVSFAAQDCALLALDTMAGRTHVYIACP